MKSKKAWDMPKTELPHNDAQTEEAQLRASIQIAEKIIKALEEIVS